MHSSSSAATTGEHNPGSQRTLFGHPIGLYVLFSTELFERFSFYSMRGILTLYTAAIVLKDQAGAGERADSIYGAYLGFVYSSTFIGGMLADRLLGQRRAIYIGGTLMALAQFTLCGHALLMRDGSSTPWLNAMFFLGLGLLSTGNGFFKPNISTIVGTLYQQGDARRDTAFTIFYMGINIGAFFASFSGEIAQKFGWHLGFLLAGTGMIIGQLVFFLGLKTIEGKGLPPANASMTRGGVAGIPNVLLLILGVAAFIPGAAWFISHPAYVQDLAIWMAGPIVAYLTWEAARGRGDSTGDRGSIGMVAAVAGGTALAAALLSSYHEQLKLPALLWQGLGVVAALAELYLISVAIRFREGGQMVVILVLCTFSMMFWGFFELAGSTITRFTDEKINRVIFGWEASASFLSNFFNPLLIIAMCIPFSFIWIWLDRKRLEPSSPFKFVFGLSFLALGFLALYVGAKQAGTGGKCSLLFLIGAFFLHTIGELCLSPVGLSTITKLSPPRLVGMFMGVWFLSSALGNVLAPRIAKIEPGAAFDDVFFRIAMIALGGGALLLVLVIPLKKMMHGVK